MFMVIKNLIVVTLMSLFVCASWKGVIVFVLGMKGIRKIYG